MKNFFKNITIVSSFIVIGISCKKAIVPELLADTGKTFVKIITGDNPAPFVKQSIDFVNTPTTLNVNIQRLVANNVDLSKKMTILIKDDTSAVNFFNRDTVASNPNATNPDLIELVQMPTTWYTVGSTTTKAGGAGGTYTMVMNNGEFAKDIQITIPNATLLNPSATYALGFTIVSVDASGVIASKKSLIMGIGAKNIYDGIYENVFTNYHPSLNPGYTGATTDIHLVTTGANKVKMYFPSAGAFGNPAFLSGAILYFGAQEPEYTINTVTNEVTVQNVFSGAVTFYTMNSSFNSRYDAASKTFFIKFGYGNPGGVFSLATSREWTQTMTYKKSR